MSCVDITAPAPRVNYQLLSQYIGKRVAIVGKIEGFEGNALRLRTSDDAMLTVHLQGAVPQVRRWKGGAGGERPAVWGAVSAPRHC